MIISQILEECLKEGEDFDEFCDWAFGPGYKNFFTGMEAMEAWNILHNQEFSLTDYGDPHEDVYKMVELWRNSK